MPTGRRDGRVSQAAAVNLPGPTLSVAAATSAFTAKGLTQADMVTLLGILAYHIESSVINIISLASVIS